MMLNDAQALSAVESWAADPMWRATCPTCGRKLDCDRAAEVGQFREGHVIPLTVDIECPDCGWWVQIEALHVLAPSGVRIESIEETC